jgi:hypothetical protein
MRRKDSERDILHGTRYEKRAMPDARRQEHGASNARGLGKMQDGKLETRPFFRDLAD